MTYSMSIEKVYLKRSKEKIDQFCKYTRQSVGVTVDQIQKITFE